MGQQFSPIELPVMEEFRDSDRLSVRELQESFPEKDQPPYTSMTEKLIVELERKGRKEHRR